MNEIEKRMGNYLWDDYKTVFYVVVLFVAFLGFKALLSYIFKNKQVSKYTGSGLLVYRTYLSQAFKKSKLKTLLFLLMGVGIFFSISLVVFWFKREVALVVVAKYEGGVYNYMQNHDLLVDLGKVFYFWLIGWLFVFSAALFLLAITISKSVYLELTNKILFDLLALLLWLGFLPQGSPWYLWCLWLFVLTFGTIALSDLWDKNHLNRDVNKEVLNKSKVSLENNLELN